MRKKAVLLFSGGLDSILASFIAKREGLKLHALYFHTIFSTQSIKEAKEEYTFKLEELRIPLKIIDFSYSHIRMVKHSIYGYGANLNPCVDCKIFMFAKAKEFMRKVKASFIISGEVLGERPMSQRRDLFNKIERETKLEGLILRPLSAKLLKPTLPEREGIINRRHLYSIQGRSRKQQFALAKEFGIKNFPTPSGGCLLTNPSFCLRLKDLLHYNPDFSLRDCKLLKLGRHFRLNPHAKLIISRNEKENALLSRFKNALYFYPSNPKAPIALGIGKFNHSLIKKACLIIGRYCKDGSFPLVIRVDGRKVMVRVKVPSSFARKFLIAAK